MADKIKIIGTGLNGLVGSRVSELLSGEFEFTNISRATGVDITNKEQVEHAISESIAEIVLHLAAKTDVDSSEKEKHLGENSEVWQINVNGTKNVAEACVKTNKKLIYVSTDLVFDGEQESYDEESTPDPVNFYGVTKYEGEKIVKALTSPWIIVRPAYPYRAEFEKKDFVRAMLSRVESGQQIKAVTDHYFMPTFIDDFAQTLGLLIEKNQTGIFHTTGASLESPFTAAGKIATEFGLDQKLISQTTREEFFKDRAQRPFRLFLKNDKIGKLGGKMKTFEEGLEEIKRQRVSKVS